jgi:hypothetical protein
LILAIPVRCAKLLIALSIVYICALRLYDPNGANMYAIASRSAANESAVKTPFPFGVSSFICMEFLISIVRYTASRPTRNQGFGWL